MEYSNEFDGIWACSSLLHLSKLELSGVFEKMIRALFSVGYIYMSFKYGDFSRERNDAILKTWTRKVRPSMIKTR
jgi:hypothetical protein